jgi:hypothetical protein
LAIKKCKNLCYHLSRSTANRVEWTLVAQNSLMPKEPKAEWLPDACKYPLPPETLCGYKLVGGKDTARQPEQKFRREQWLRAQNQLRITNYELRITKCE